MAITHIPGPTWLRIFSRNRGSVVAAFILAALFALAILAPIFLRFEPGRINVGPSMSPPDLTHLMGTDELGRDVFSRATAGLSVSLMVGFGAAS